MNRYILIFKKTGLVRFTSHLDMVRLFKRAFKKMDVPLSYSQGFNPHPKMTFAQPLSLGYTSLEEILEFETTTEIDEVAVFEGLKKHMALGLELVELKGEGHSKKTLASLVTKAEFEIDFGSSLDLSEGECTRLIASFLMQPEILAEKRAKKTKKLKEVDIKPMIYSMEWASHGKVNCLLACGSASNLSPELLITSFLKFANAEIPRWEVLVCRKKLIFEGLEI